MPVSGSASGLSLPTSHARSYLRFQNDQAKLWLIGTKFFAPIHWPRGYLHVSEVGSALEMVQEDDADRQLYDRSSWDILQQPFAYESTAAAAASRLYPFVPELGPDKNILLPTLHYLVSQIADADEIIQDERTNYALEEEAIRASLLQGSMNVTAGVSLSPDVYVSALLGLSGLGRNYPDFAAGLKPDDIKIRKDANSEVIPDVDVKTFLRLRQKLIAWLPSRLNNRIIYPWLTVEINSIGGTEVEARQQVLTTMTYSVRCYLHLHRMAYRSDGDHALPASPTVCRTYGLLLLGATWHFLYGEATCPVDWLERPGNDWSKVTHAVVKFAVGSLLDVSDVHRFARILRSIGREAEERQRLLENWLWCLRQPEALAANVRLDDGSDGDDDDANDGNKGGEELGDGSRRTSHGGRSGGGKRKRGEEGIGGGAHGATSHSHTAPPSQTQVHLVPAGLTKAKSRRVSTWIESVVSAQSDDGYDSTRSDFKGEQSDCEPPCKRADSAMSVHVDLGVGNSGREATISSPAVLKH